MVSGEWLSPCKSNITLLPLAIWLRTSASNTGGRGGMGMSPPK